MIPAVPIATDKWVGFATALTTGCADAPRMTKPFSTPVRYPKDTAGAFSGVLGASQEQPLSFPLPIRPCPPRPFGQR